MTLFYYDPQFTLHQTGDHPECPERVVAVHRHLLRTGVLAHLKTPQMGADRTGTTGPGPRPGISGPTWPFGDRGGRLSRLRYRRLATVVRRGPAGGRRGRRRRNPGGRRAKIAAAFCLIRPPGHHAMADQAMGFCLLNNIAVGARVALDELDLARVLIIDWDVHHGNGTQAIFWEEPRVGFLSIHRWPFYPGTRAARRNRRRAGRGNEGQSADRIRHLAASNISIACRRDLELLAERIRPELVLVSAGFDAHRHDPIGSLGLETEDFRPLTKMVRGRGRELCRGPAGERSGRGLQPDGAGRFGRGSRGRTARHALKRFARYPIFGGLVKIVPRAPHRAIRSRRPVADARR